MAATNLLFSTASGVRAIIWLRKAHSTGFSPLPYRSNLPGSVGNPGRAGVACLFISGKVALSGLTGPEPAHSLWPDTLPGPCSAS